MPISYAGYDLLLDDPDGAIQSWIDTWHALDEIRPVQETMARRGNFATHTKGQKNGRGLPIPNYPAPPPVRLNSLYWPTGAARWATFFALCDAETGAAIQEIYKAAAAQASSQSTVIPKLILNDGETTLEIEMHLLSPRIVTVAPAEGEQVAKQLWILPLVDDRWFWQFMNVGDGEVNLTTIQAALGRTINVTAPAADYVEPDWLELNRSSENAAVLIDAFAHGFGQRFVRRFDATNYLLTWSQSSDTLVDENLTDYKQIAGGQASHFYPGAANPAPVPAKVRVTFRFWRDGIVLDHDYDHRGSVNDVVAPTVFIVDVDADDALGGDPVQGVVEGLTKTVHSTMYAIIGYEANERLNPTNETELDDLANQIAVDFYASLDHQYDYTFAGIKDWKLTGYDDHLEIRMDSASGAVTRVMSCPPNFGSEINLSQSAADVFVFGDQILVQLSGLSRYDGATALGYELSAGVYEPDPNTDPDAKEIEDCGKSIKVFSPFGNDDQGDISGFSIAARVKDVWMVVQNDSWATPQEPAPP